LVEADQRAGAGLLEAPVVWVGVVSLVCGRVCCGTKVGR
jgi:hypothetical protein